jgi:glutamate racemase
MSRIVVFDSGLGSLSIIKAIQRHTKAEIIYFADQKHFPYGKKSKKELEKIIKNTISNLQKKFKPDLIVVGSNTPSLLLVQTIFNDNTVIGVFPPLLEAQQLTKTNSIAILATNTAIQSTALKTFIKKNLMKNVKILKIDSSELVDLVESGKFIHNKNFCIKKIISVLRQNFIRNDVDVVTLSSTHLPFLLSLLQKIFPQVKFLDPADKIANEIIHHKSFFPSTKNTLAIFSSGDIETFQTNLHHIGIKKKVQHINF